MNTIAQAEVTLAEATRLYNATTDNIRALVNPTSKWVTPMAWETATAHVVMGLRDFEVTAIMRYLAGQGGLGQPDVFLAEALAGRLGLVIKWKRTELAAS
jgi:hypothetical protein